MAIPAEQPVTIGNLFCRKPEANPMQPKPAAAWESLPDAKLYILEVYGLKAA